MEKEGKLAPERPFHDAALLLIARSQRGQPGGDDAALPHVVDNPLVESAGAEIRGLLRHLELRSNCRRSGDPRHSKSGRHGLRKAGHVDDAAVLVVGFDRPGVARGRHIVEMQRAVRIVFDDENVAPCGPLEELPAFFETDEKAGRVLKIRHDVEEGNPPAGAAFAYRYSFEIVEVDPISFLGDADERRLRVSKRGDRSRVGRQFHEDDVARVDEDARDEIERLLRTGGNDHFIRRRSNAAIRQNLRQRFDKRPVSSRRPVLEDGAIRSDTVVGLNSLNIAESLRTAILGGAHSEQEIAEALKREPTSSKTNIGGVETLA